MTPRAQLSREQQLMLYAIAAAPKGITFLRLQEFLRTGHMPTAELVDTLKACGYVEAKVEDRVSMIPRQYLYCTRDGHAYLNTPE